MKNVTQLLMVVVLMGVSGCQLLEPVFVWTGLASADDGYNPVIVVEEVVDDKPHALAGIKGRKLRHARIRYAREMRKNRSIDGIEVPEITLVDAKISEQTVDGASVTLVGMLENKNDVELPIEKIEYEFMVEGRGMYEGTFTPRVTAPANESQLLEMTAAIAGRNMKGRTYHFWARVTYSAKSNLRVILTESGFPLPWKEFAATGTLR